ncbi:hypothetical protein [Sphingomonas sp. Root241]|uniref:hypothetical protein n=1 Tax=Sphingomonas sp. Root241 TaxID=1736501 RepID=UPI0006FF5647|nr:hypothetical protein [Sphingomonas sp. Root241]KRC81723.1 hypothetical protein ASE13_04935 [Sphingomonas sp. Root241]
MIDRSIKYPARFSIFLVTLCATPVVDRLASLSEYVTYINTFYRLLSLATCLVVCVGFPKIVTLSSRALLIPAIYVVTFIITSMRGVNPEFSIDNRLFLLPLIMVDFFQWFLAGLIFNEKSFQKKVYFYGAIYGFISIVLALTDLIDVDQARVIAGPDIPVALVAAIASNQVIYAVFLMVAAIGSLKKTVVLCSVGGAAIALFLMRVGRTKKKKVGGKRFKYPAFLQFTIFVGIVIPFLFVAFPYIDQTVVRLFGEQEDVMRTAMFDEFNYLLPIYFPWGTGYYTFGYLTRDTISYGTLTADGREVLGMSLHNTILHVLLEGGAIVFGCFVILYSASIVYAIKLFKSLETRPVAIVMLSWLFVALVYGLTNQLHATRYYFGIVGFCYGVYYRYRQVQFTGVRNALFVRDGISI